jgi:Glycosyltransferase family 87
MVLSGDGEGCLASITVSWMLRELAVTRSDAFVRTVVRVGLIAVAIVVWALTVRTLGFAPSVQGSDAWNYLAAGERLNAGHPLYALTAGDRAIPLLPPYWTVPLLAPPPIAVVWRPLAALGETSMTIWAAAVLIATLATTAWLLVRGGVAAAVIIAVLALSLAEQSLSGNANGFLFAGLVLAWVYRRRPWIAGSLVAVAVAVKLTPALLVIWLATSRRWSAVAATIGALFVIGAVSLAFAGVQNHLDWLVSLPNAAPAPTSIAGITGLPSTLVLVALAVVVVLVSRFGDERVTFSVAVVAAALASPALYLGTLGIAAAAAAPWIDPLSATPLRREPAR